MTGYEQELRKLFFGFVGERDPPRMAGPGNGRLGRDVLPKLPDGQLDARGLGRAGTAGRRSGGPHQRRRQQAVPFPVDDGFFGVTHGKAARHDRIE